MVCDCPAFARKVPIAGLRTDNCVKNHFYSKLRKVIRRINKVVSDQWKKEYREIKMCTLYKIVETNE
jgi:hypothetical protein